MMKRAKGATLAEIMKATGWQRHTVDQQIDVVLGPLAEVHAATVLLPFRHIDHRILGRLERHVEVVAQILRSLGGLGQRFFQVAHDGRIFQKPAQVLMTGVSRDARFSGLPVFRVALGIARARRLSRGTMRNTRQISSSRFSITCSVSRLRRACSTRSSGSF